MKKLLAAALFVACVSTAALQAAPLDVVNVRTQAIGFLYSTSGVAVVDETTTPITLPGGTGTGFLQTRVITGGPGTPAAGLYGYEYRIDLTGITASNTEPCLTNLVRCVTNNVVQYENRRVQFTNAAGKVHTRNGRVAVATNQVIRCTTNTVRCPGTAPCIEALAIRFGNIVTNLDFNTNNLADDAYVVTNGTVGTVAPTSVDQNDGIVTFVFSNAVCAGESSYSIGLVSSNPPVDVQALLGLTGGAFLHVEAQAPGRARTPITCDFDVLEGLLDNADLEHIMAPNDNAKRGRLGALQNRLTAARIAAEAGDADEVGEIIMSIAKKASGDRNAWLHGPLATAVMGAIQDLLACVDQFDTGDDDGDDDDDDDEDDD